MERAHTSNFFRTNQVTPFKYLQVLHKRGQRHIERLGQFRHGSGAAREPFQHLPPRRVGERLKGLVEIVLIVRHLTKYTGYEHLGQYLSVPKAIHFDNERCQQV